MKTNKCMETAAASGTSFAINIQDPFNDSQSLYQNSKDDIYDAIIGGFRVQAAADARLVTLVVNATLEEDNWDTSANELQHSSCFNKKFNQATIRNLSMYRQAQHNRKLSA